MGDIRSPTWMWIKGALFLLIGVASAVLLVLETPNWRVVALLVLAVWAFCRAYYFAFYVIGKYVDPNYRFSGLVSFIKYLLREPEDRGPKGTG